MSDDVLLRFVERNLINVGGDDAKLEKLRQAAGDLSEILKGAPTKTLAFSLAAFDPDISETDPAVTESADALRGRWETYVNTFSSTPVVICRAILTDALARAARDSEAVAIGFAACARNLLPFMEIGGEQEIWADVVAEVERGVEEARHSPMGDACFNRDPEYQARPHFSGQEPHVGEGVRQEGSYKTVTGCRWAKFHQSAEQRGPSHGRKSVLA